MNNSSSTVVFGWWSCTELEWREDFFDFTLGRLNFLQRFIFTLAELERHRSWRTAATIALESFCISVLTIKLLDLLSKIWWLR